MSIRVDSPAGRRRRQRLSRAPPFSAFPPDALDEVAAAAVDRAVRRGGAVFHAGDAPTAAWVVDRGAVRLSSTTLEGRPVVFRLAGPSESFGLSSSLGRLRRASTARAVTDARLVAVPAAALHQALERSPPAALACAAYLAKALRRERERVSRFASGDIRWRLCEQLRDLSRSHGISTSDGLLIDVPLRHEDLAGLVGTSRETVTRAMAALAARGLLRRIDDRYVVPVEPGVAPPSTA